MAEIVGRPLLRSESVHHKNGDRLDNRPENLELWVSVQPSGQRVEDRVRDAVLILHRYAPELLGGAGTADMVSRATAAGVEVLAVDAPLEASS